MLSGNRIIIVIMVCCSYPMVRYTDMDENMRKDVMEVCTNACEKHTANNELVRNLFVFKTIAA